MLKVGIAGPQLLQGKITPPASKAYTHRAMVASLLARGRSTIRSALLCDDTVRTEDTVQELGARIEEEKDKIEVRGVGVPSSPNRYLDCGDSGATLRFLTAVAATGTEKTSFTTKTGLANRPIEPLLSALNRLGAFSDLYQDKDLLRVTVQGPLKGGETTIPGDISSQFISGLLFASPLARNDVTIRVEGHLESKPYVELTLAILSKHGIKAEYDEGTFHIQAPQEYKPTTHEVPPDFSSAAFILAAGATVGEATTLTRMKEAYATEPDSIILELLPTMGVRMEKSGDCVTVSKSALSGFEFDASDHPDLVPVLEVLAAQASGKTSITGVQRLRYKESDRLTTIPAELGKMGAQIHIDQDQVTINGIEHLAASKMSSHHDHRVAMACTVAALAAGGKSLVEDAGVVSKSYPAFYNDLEILGAKLDVE